MIFRALLLLLCPAVTMAATTEDAVTAGGGVVAAVVAAVVGLRARSSSRVRKGTKGDADRFGWSKERAALEARHAHHAAKRSRKPKR
jgi:hypothetical protein